LWSSVVITMTGIMAGTTMTIRSSSSIAAKKQGRHRNGPASARTLAGHSLLVDYRGV
jgi:hypothetical protein